jgi:hypothetical protein
MSSINILLEIEEIVLLCLFKWIVRHSNMVHVQVEALDAAKVSAAVETTSFIASLQPLRF